MNIFQHVAKPAIIAAYCMQKLRALIAHETKSEIIVQNPYARIADYSMQLFVHETMALCNEC